MGIQDYFKGKNILITGATGFMGKALVEKLLRSCPDISTIYIVIRAKKGTLPQDRWREITKLRLFDSLKSKQPNALDKVVAIRGESTEDNFGISEEDEKILTDNVNIIYHVAASVRFTEELKSAIQLNVKSTYSMLELARKTKNLECFVHTSTAYSNVEKIGQVVDERVYESPLDWRLMLKIADDPAFEKSLPAIQPRIMSGHGTTYTLTKRVAESLAEEYSKYFPVVIMRPSLVIATLEDPIRGWLDAHNALTLMCDAVRCGIVRVLNCDKNKCLQYIPLDFSIKAFLIATWNVHRKQMVSGVEVYCTSLGGEDSGLSLTWGQLIEYGVTICQEYPAKRQIWYPFCFSVRNHRLLTVVFFFLQVIPALLGDMINSVRGVKPQFLSLTTKFYKALTGPLRDFTGMNYHFSLVNYNNLDAILLPEDKASFSLDQSTFNAMDMYRVNAEGMVKYVLNEDLSLEGLKKRRKRSQMFLIAHRVVCAVLIAMASYFVTWRVSRIIDVSSYLRN